MNKSKHTIILTTIIIIATAFMISATYMENLDRNIRILIGFIYTAIIAVTSVVNLIYILKKER